MIIREEKRNTSWVARKEKENAHTRGKRGKESQEPNLRVGGKRRNHNLALPEERGVLTWQAVLRKRIHRRCTFGQGKGKEAAMKGGTGLGTGKRKTKVHS